MNTRYKYNSQSAIWIAISTSKLIVSYPAKRAQIAPLAPKPPINALPGIKTEKACDANEDTTPADK
jgi:hypothetical protein